MAEFSRQLKLARELLGWDEETMARALRLAGPPEKTVARVREMEAGKRDISGPVQVVLEAFLSGWRPSGWFEENRSGGVNSAEALSAQKRGGAKRGR